MSFTAKSLIKNKLIFIRSFELWRKHLTRTNGNVKHLDLFLYEEGLNFNEKKELNRDAEYALNN